MEFGDVFTIRLLTARPTVAARWRAADRGGGGAHAELATVVPAFLHRARPVPLAPEPEQMVQRATALVPRRGLLARVA